MLTQTLAQLRANVRLFADVGGTTALLRHPDANLNDYINRALGSLHRLLTAAMADQRILSTTPITTEDAITTYSLPTDFDHLISADLYADGVKTWLHGYEMHERPLLTDPSQSYSGIPLGYRLRGQNIELLPSPTDGLTVTLWYVPTAAQLTGDASTYDTISRLDDYIIAYAARFIGVRDKNADLVAACAALVSELREEVQMIAVHRDKNSPPRPVDEHVLGRYGRRLTWRRRWPR